MVRNAANGTCLVVMYISCMIGATASVIGVFIHILRVRLLQVSRFSGSENSVDIYDANGILLRKGVSKEVLDDMAPGLYIVRKGDRLNKFIIR